MNEIFPCECVVMSNYFEYCSEAPKQLPTDQASPGQIKYLKDLTGKCGTTLKKWCQSKGVSENNITGGHCQEWIPELQNKAENEYF